MFLAFIALVTSYNQYKKAVPTRFVNYNVGFSCNTCKKIVEYIKELLNDETDESEISSLINQLCMTFQTPYDTLCLEFTNEYLPFVIEWLKRDINSTVICKNLIFCSNSQINKKITRKITNLKSNRNRIKYDIFKQIVDHIENLLKSQTIESEISSNVDNFCLSYLSPYDSICKNFVDQNLQTIIKYIKQGLNSSEICEKFGIYQTSIKIKRKIEKSQNSCNMCNHLIKYIESLYKDQLIESEITALVDQLCSTFVSPYDSLCKSFIEQNIQVILDLIQQEINSLDICIKIGFCPSESCNTCKSWFKWIRNSNHNITCDKLWKLISEECPNRPYLKYFCQNINEQNIETFISLILSELPPEKCCEWINFC